VGKEFLFQRKEGTSNKEISKGREKTLIILVKGKFGFPWVIWGNIWDLGNLFNSFFQI